MVPVRVLFDNGSQRSYLTNSLKIRLGLKPQRKEVVNLNVFGNNGCKRQTCDLVTIKLQTKESEDIQLTALAFQLTTSQSGQHSPVSLNTELRPGGLSDNT